MQSQAITIRLPAVNDWQPKGTPKVLDPEVLSRSDQVTINLEKPGAEDALLAAGMALAKGVPTVLAAPDRSDLPWFLRDADLSYPSQVTVVDTSPPVDPAPVDQSPAPTPKEVEHDTFIGCLMSGLSKEQYAEGRSHLTQIHETLRDELDSPNNFCEGIKVGSIDSFGSPKEALVTDLDAIKGSEQCLFYQYDDSSRPSGMWVELGAALAWGKPCTLFTPNLKGVPPAIKEGKLPQLRVVEYGSHKQLQRLLQNQPEVLEKEVHPSGLRSREVELFTEMGQQLDRPVTEGDLKSLGRFLNGQARSTRDLDREQRLELLRGAIEAYPSKDSLFSDQALDSIWQVDKIRNESWDSDSGIKTVGVSWRSRLSTPEERPTLLQAHRAFIELREAAQTGGYEGDPDFPASKALRTEIFGNPDPAHRQFLSLVGDATMSQWASEELKGSGPSTRARVDQLRPGMKKKEFVRLVQLAATAPDQHWQRFSQSPTYATPLRIEESLTRLDLPMDEHWGAFEGFAQRLKGRNMNEEQVLGLMDWTVENYQQLGSVMPEDRDLPGAVADALVNSWRGAAEDSRQFLDEVLQADPGSSWRETAGQVADTYWLHGSFEGRDQNLARVREVFENGELAAETVEAATEEFEHRLRLQRLIRKEPGEAVNKALESLTRPVVDEIDLETIEDGLMVGDHFMEFNS